MPQRFGYDTRRVQYSSLILTGQMQREEALVELSNPSYPVEEAERDFDYVADKLAITSSELQEYFAAPKKVTKIIKIKKHYLTLELGH